MSTQRRSPSARGGAEPFLSPGSDDAHAVRSQPDDSCRPGRAGSGWHRQERMMTDSRILPHSSALADQAGGTVDRVASADVAPGSRAAGHERRSQVHAAEVGLLYENATTAVWASVLIALPLAYV